MIVGGRFRGDRNESLMWIQHDLYSSLLGYLYHCSRDRYLRAARYVGVQTELAAIISEKEGFDHRVLQDAHDYIAACYRFSHDDGGQIPLGAEPRQYDELLRGQWSSFFQEEARNLAEFDAISLAILGAVAYQNTEKGYDCEGQLLSLLKEHYPDFSGGR